MVAEEVVLPYPPNARATRFRATWLASSLKAARERGYLDRYLANLPKKYHDPILHSVAGEWLPVEIAVAHYAALDELALPEADIVSIGEEVNHRFHNVFLQTVLRLARGLGVTPWTVTRHAQKMWDRTWEGGGYAAFKLGPTEMRAEVVGWPCARFRYTRVALRGVFGGTLSLFCRRAWVEELPKLCTETTLGYRIHWV